MGSSVVIFILKSAFPPLPAVGRLPNTELYFSNMLVAVEEPEPRVLQARVEGPFLYMNAQHVREKVADRVLISQRDDKEPLQVVVLDFSAVTGERAACGGVCVCVGCGWLRGRAA